MASRILQRVARQAARTSAPTASLARSLLTSTRGVSTMSPVAQSRSLLSEAAKARPSVSTIAPLSLFARSFADVLVPGMGDSISEGTVLTWSKNVGDYVEVDEEIVEIETDKITVPIAAEQAGILKEQKAAEGDTVTVGDVIAIIEPGEAPAGSAAPAPAKEAAPAAAAAAAAAPAKPAAAPTPAAPKPAAAKPAAPKPAAVSDAKPVGSRTETRVPMSRMRKRISERLKEAQNTYAMLTTFNEIDMSAIMAMRSKHKDAFLEKHGVKLGFMSAFTKAAANSLQNIPSVNAVIDGDDIVYRDYVDVSVAVATPNGLVVPVVRNVEAMSFAGIEKEINNLGQRARDGQLSLEDMTGGTFTISNGGVYGSMMGTPIINTPQSAILGMHGIQKRPVVVGPDDRIEARPVMFIALTYDHRIIDGREAVTFLKSIKEQIEDPTRFLLE